jgi:ribosomal protein S27AE
MPLPPPKPVIMSLQDDRHKCPYCGTGVDLSQHYGKCHKCSMTDPHYHEGVQKPKACGPRAGFWTHLFRWCWLKEPHLHFGCDYCGGNWIGPPVGVQGEPTLTKKPTKHQDRYHRDKVI